MNLKNVNHIDKFKKLPYNKNEMLIVGSGLLALLGLKENQDIDLWVTKNVHSKMATNKDFIPSKSKLDGSILYHTKDDAIEAGISFPPFKDIKESLKKAVVVDGIYFQSPKDVLKWKRWMNRPKDIGDIKKLENYLKNNIVEGYLKKLFIN